MKLSDELFFRWLKRLFTDKLHEMRAETTEEAARICDGIAQKYISDGHAKFWAEKCADEIRKQLPSILPEKQREGKITVPVQQLPPMPWRRVNGTFGPVSAGTQYGWVRGEDYDLLREVATSIARRNQELEKGKLERE